LSITKKGLDAVRKACTEASKEAPIWKVVVEDVFGQKDKVAVRMTHWNGGKPVRNVIAIYRFHNGKIIDDWAAISELKHG
jgi:hypothetical protein